MTDGIRSRPPGPSGTSRPSTSVETSKSRDTAPAPEALGNKEASQASRDVFEAGGGARPAGPLAKSGQANAARSLADVQFSNQDLAYLAGVLSSIVKKNPKASRTQRAKSFTRAILKGKGKMAKVIERMDEQESEQMFDDIASMLSDSPRLAEWIDNVAEELQKF